MPTRRVMLDHVTIGVSDLQRSRDFYLKALAPLGFDETNTSDALPSEIEFGSAEKMDFAISTDYGVGAPIHVAFAADSIEQVHAFHAAALAAGGQEHGPPGPRPHYGEGYYGAFVLDPDGHNIEAVFHG
ncbi:MAG TPA: VOC family protein [Solirubrobacteraceae bacterium]|nr:VOC family protein [Solirubrobacteraceae bacterium]